LANPYLHGKSGREDHPPDQEKEPVTKERLKEEVAAYMREKGMDSWWNQHTIELIEIGWKRVEEAEG